MKKMEGERRQVVCTTCKEKFLLSANYTGGRFMCKECRRKLPRSEWGGGND